MSSGRRAKREARGAASAAQVQSQQLQQQRQVLEDRTKKQKAKAQSVLIRAFRARAGGFFAGDDSGTLG